jgi:ubiquitin-protein ligase
MYWKLEFIGQPGTLLENGNYDVEIRIPERYPAVAPECHFQHKFEHVYVYDDGKVCMPMLHNKSWDPLVSMVDLAKLLVNMIHSKPNPKNKANVRMAKMYENYKRMKSKEDIEKTEYYKIMTAQGKRLSKHTKIEH